MIGANLTSGLVIAGASTVIEGYLLRQLPALRRTCIDHKTLALCLTLATTAVVSVSAGASGVIVLVAQSVSTVVSLTVLYRRKRNGGRLTSLFLSLAISLDDSVPELRPVRT